MPRPSQETKILEAALHCFARLGYDATRIKIIADEAGVSEAALYRHYSSKEALAETLFWGCLKRCTREMARIAAQEEQPPEMRLKAIIGSLLAFYRSDTNAALFVLLRPPGFKLSPAEDTLYPIEIVERLIEEGQAKGALRAGKPNLLAAIFLGCVLRPVIVAEGSAPGALDLLGEPQYDDIIIDAAWSAIAGRLTP